MLDRLKSTFFYICWLPLFLYVLADFYIATYEGWGQWAMGVVVLPTLLLSAGFFTVGLVVTSHCREKREPVILVALATLLAGSVFLWFLARSLLIALLNWL